jgi:hypothetical protein
MAKSLLSDNGVVYFCRKVQDSHQEALVGAGCPRPYPLWEQRFDKLYEAFEILCRYVPAPAGLERSRVGMTHFVRGALGRVKGPSWDSIREIIASDVLLVSVQNLAALAVFCLEDEKKAAYEADVKLEMNRLIGYFNDDRDGFTQHRLKDAPQAAYYLLMLFVTLRNGRFHAYAGTAGFIIGHDWILEPCCTAFEQVLLRIAAGLFGVDRVDLEGVLGSPEVEEFENTLWMRALDATGCG